MNIEIIHAPTDSKPFLVIYKPKGLASAPLVEGDTENALAQAIEKFPEICGVHGKKKIEYGLLHRLDTATDGLMVIATTQECYDFLTEEQREGRFIVTFFQTIQTHSVASHLTHRFRHCEHKVRSNLLPPHHTSVHTAKAEKKFAL